MADYPDWVLKHKKKGTYINKVGDKYYLYAAHSERVKGTTKVRRVCDGYLGRITQKDGLIPPKDKVRAVPIVLEYGLAAAILPYSHNIYSGFKRSFKNNAPYVMVASILTLLHGSFDETVYGASCLSLIFPGLDMGRIPTKTQSVAIRRGGAMLQDVLKREWGEDYPTIFLYFPFVHMAVINGKQYLSSEPGMVKELRGKYEIEWEVPSWLK